MFGRPHADEADRWPASSRCGGHDHHLGLAERLVAHRGPVAVTQSGVASGGHSSGEGVERRGRDARSRSRRSRLPTEPVIDEGPTRAGRRSHALAPPERRASALEDTAGRSKRGRARRERRGSAVTLNDGPRTGGWPIPFDAFRYERWAFTPPRLWRHGVHGSSATSVKTRLPSRRAVATIRSAPSDGRRSRAHRRARTCSAIGWKVVEAPSSPSASAAFDERQGEPPP